MAQLYLFSLENGFTNPICAARSESSLISKEWEGANNQGSFAYTTKILFLKCHIVMDFWKFLLVAFVKSLIIEIKSKYEESLFPH